MFPYGFPPGYNPHHSRPSTLPSVAGQVGSVDDVTDASCHTRARLDGGRWISQDGEWIYHQRFGYWRAAWNGDGFGAWEPVEELPEGVVML